MSPPLIKKELDNGIIIYVTHDNLLDNDLIVLFKNYGSCLDNHIGISGFQHLLEHAFFLYDDNNLNLNAYTSFEDMGLELNFNDKKTDNEVFKVLKKWLFKNNDLTRLDFGLDVDLSTIDQLINELENEYLYRDLLSSDLLLQNFLASEKKYHYGGGNLLTFQNKQREIKKWLKDPLPIPTEDIIIYLRYSYKNLLEPLQDLFKHIKPIKRVKINSLSFLPLYNKNIQLNHSRYCELVFIIPEDKVSDEDLNIVERIIYGFDYSKVDYMKEYYVNFRFLNPDDLCRTIISLEHSYDVFVKSIIPKETISPIIYQGCLPVSYDPKLANFNGTSYLKEKEDDFKKTIMFLADLVKKRRYMVRTPVGYFYLYQTEIGEPYNIHDINFNYKHIFSKTDPNISLVRRFETNSLQDIKCFNTEYNLRDNNHCCNYSGVFQYEKALLNFYVNPSITTLEEARQRDILFTPDINVQLRNNMTRIFTPYDFVFFCFQTKRKEMQKFINCSRNLLSQLKHQGLVYFLRKNFMYYPTISHMFMFTICNPLRVEEMINFVKSFFLSNNFNFRYEIIISEHSLVEDTTALTKKITVSF